MTEAERLQMLAALDRAIDCAGGMHPLAQRINVTRQAVYQWRHKGVPADRVVDIEGAVEGQVTRRELRPDLHESCATAA